MAKIIRIEPNKYQPFECRKKVAAYARVSRDTEKLMHSVSAQISYYNNLIQKNPNWEYVDVYADEGITGTSMEKRDEFQKMLEDCEVGKIDLILTKSVSRFARNTVDLLEIVRHLKELGIEIYFEEQNISTLSGDGELMLTILASFAQEESVSMSQNIIWAKRKQYEKGIMSNTVVPYGYRYNPETRSPIIEENEAMIVKEIYSDYINDMSVYQIAKKLNEAGIPSPRGTNWLPNTVKRILENINYTGNMLFGKFYSDGPLTQKHTKNRGERPMYYSEENHEAIIDMDTFNKVKEKFKYNSEYGAYRSGTRNCFSKKIVCECCGKFFGRCSLKMAKGIKHPAWECKKRAKDTGKCAVVTVLEEDLKQICVDLLNLDEFTEEAFESKVEKITVNDQDYLHFYLKDGQEFIHYYPRRRKLRAEGKKHG